MREPRSFTVLALCLAVALASVAVTGTPGVLAQGLSPIDSLRLADSLKAAEDQRIADSTFTADSLAAEEEFAGTGEAFGNRTSILDRPRDGAPLTYNTTYSVNRSNRNWSQSANVFLTKGNVEIASVTDITVGREARVGRLNRNRRVQVESAYRLSSALRLGGRLGIQRISDEANTANFAPTKQDVDDLSAQARFNRKFGEYPLRAVTSYGYLKNAQFQQQSRGTSFDFYGATSRAFTGGSALNFDLTRQTSRLRSTVASDPGYEQDDRNTNTSIRLSSVYKINRNISADARISTQRSQIKRPVQIVDFVTEEVTVLPETIDGVNDLGDAALHIQLPYRTSVNVSGSISRNRSIYSAEEDRSYLVDRKGFTADVRKWLLGGDWTARFENSNTDNDYTRKDPGYVEANLNRRLDVDGGRPVGAHTTARFSGSITLTRRQYLEFRSASVNSVKPSDQDQLRGRASLNLNYKPGPLFDTGLTLGLEQNELVNLGSSASINNATLRTYSVTWNWGIRPGSIWSVSQYNSASAAQQYFTFSPERDQLSFIYSLNTTLTSQLSQKVRLDLNNIVRLQSRGSFRSDGDVRRFGKSSEFNTFDLSLRAQYALSSFTSFEAGQRLSVNPNYTFTNGQSAKVNESRRNEFTLAARFNYPFGKRARLNGDIRRVLATDRAQTFGVAQSDRATNSDYWFASASFNLEFMP